MRNLIIPISAILFISCASIAKGLVAPNQCKKCEVYDTQTGEVLSTHEGCGSSNVRLEEDAKVKAFEIMRGGNCNIDVRCETWKQEPVE
jgi:hypothetical protein